MRYEFIPVSECEMCGSTRHKVLGMRLNRSQGRRPRQVSGIGVSVKKCMDCELVFSDPRPRPSDLADHYGVPPESYWTSPEVWKVPDDFFQVQVAEAKQLLGDTAGMKALDIGAGLGNGMIALQRAGFEVYGIEPSAPFRNKALERTGVAPANLQLASVEDADFPAGSFDLVTFGAVLEHIQEPGRAIERAMQWLRPGGVMHAEVPSSRWLMNTVANMFFALQRVNYVSNLSPMHSPFHLYEFWLESFKRHAMRAGYELALHRIDVSAIYHLPKAMHPLLRACMKTTGTGMQLTVWLRKK